MSFKIHRVVNGDTPNKESVLLKATADVNLSGYALVDRTFDDDGEVSNEFRHIFVFPDMDLEEGEFVQVITGTGTKDKGTFKDTTEEYHILYWGADSCVWNDNGSDVATLINFRVVSKVKVPPTDKK